jgi:hypothetical protein
MGFVPGYAMKQESPPRPEPGGRKMGCEPILVREAVSALATLGLGGFQLEAHLLADGGAGHIMHMLRNLSRFTTRGSICSGRVFLLCAECGAMTATAWFVRHRKETPLPSPRG